MATIHVIYDPHDRLQVPGKDKMPPNVSMVAIRCDDPVENADVAELARKLATLLLEQL